MATLSETGSHTQNIAYGCR